MNSSIYRLFFNVSFTVCSITLILVSSDDEGSCDGHMTYLLELVFSAMVLVLGLQELDAVQNVERLKRDLKVRDHVMVT